MECSEDVWCGKPANGKINPFQGEVNACVKIDREGDSFAVGVKEGCVMSLWLFSIFMDGYMKEM